MYTKRIWAKIPAGPKKIDRYGDSGICIIEKTLYLAYSEDIDIIQTQTSIEEVLLFTLAFFIGSINSNYQSLSTFSLLYSHPTNKLEFFFFSIKHYSNY